MAQVNNIKDLYENEDLSLREISRKTGHSFKTVQKYAYQLNWSDDNLPDTEPKSYPVLGDFIPVIDAWLEDDRKIPRKQRHTVWRIFCRLRDEYSFGGSYSSVKKYVRKKRFVMNSKNSAYLPLEHALGSGQVDFGNGYYLIDLYFPQLNIGIECDEEHHKRKVEQDISREITIFDILKQVKNISEYQALHVDVTRSYAEIEEEINFHVHTIHSCIESQKRNGCFTAWRDVSPYEYFAEKDTISIDSDIGFRTISETCNTLFATEYKGNVQQSWFIPSTFRKKYGQQYTVWFPKLAVENKAVVGNWHNELSPDGRRIIEFNESSQWTAENERTDLNESRVTFAHVLDPITRRNEYQDVRWGLKRHAENGTSKLYNKPCYGYRRNDVGELEIVEDEAAIVRRVNAMYLCGMSIVKIKAALEEDNTPSPTGKEQWSKHTLEFMLANTKYYGTSVIFKTHTPEYKAKRKVNDTEVNSYATEGNNEPIIPEEVFDRVQEERSRRSNIEVGEDGVKKRKSTKYSAKKKE